MRHERAGKYGRDPAHQSSSSPECSSAWLVAVSTTDCTGVVAKFFCTITGKVTVLCDRCLEELELPVDTGFKLSVKFGEGAETADAGDREIVMIPEGSQELDLSQFVYDYTCISLPMRRVHPEGECNPEALKYLSTEESAGDAPSAGSPFAALKDILK